MLTSDLRPLTSVSVPGSPPWLPPSLLQRPAPVRVSFRFSRAEQNIFRKRKPIKVSDWAERHRVVTRGPLQGSRFRKETQPDICDIMDAAYFPGVQYITLCASPQTAKSFTVDTCVGYAIDRDPGPCLYVYPDENTGTENLRDRILPMIKKSGRLRSYMMPGADEVSGRRVNLQHMQLYIGWAGSPVSLGNKSIKLVVMDEIDKYPPTSSKREGSPIDLTEARTTVYRYMGRKIFKVSTPTVLIGPVWVSLMTEVQVIFDRFVRCPDCGRLQLMVFTQIKWPEGERDPEVILARDLAWYECLHCGSRWSDHKRNAAVRWGQWMARPRTEEGLQREEPVQEATEELFEYLRKHRPLKIGFHRPSWISRWVGLSEVAAAFLKGQKDKTALKNWNNKHRAMPWKDATVERKEDAILRLCDERPRGLVPSGGVVSCLTAGADTQKYGFWFEVRAWGYGLTQESWQIREGYVESWEALLQIFRGDVYKDVDGNPYRVRLVVQDAMGVKERTIEVYDMARMHRNFLLPFKGEERLSSPHTWSKIDVYPGTTKPIPGGIRLLRADTNFFKNQLAAKLEIAPADPGAWHFHSETTETWARHMCAEYIDEKGFWQCPDGKDNHGWDCSVYNLVAADVLGVRFWPKEKPAPRPEEAPPPAKPGGWFKGMSGEKWFGKR